MKILRSILLVTAISSCGAIVPALAKGKPGGNGGGSTPPPYPEIALINASRNKPEQLILINADGSNVTSILSSSYINYVDLSPQYDELVYDYDSGTTVPVPYNQLNLLQFHVDSTGITADAPITLVQFNDLHEMTRGGDISPDGNYVVYVVGDATVEQNVYVRKLTDASGDPGTKIFSVGPVSSSGQGIGTVRWLYYDYVHSGIYTIAIPTYYGAASPQDCRIYFFTFDPTTMDLKRDSNGNPVPAYSTLDTANEPFTIGNMDCARTCDNLVVEADYKYEQSPTGPKGMFIAAEKAVEWHPDGSYDELTDPAVQGNTVRFPKLSPDDSKLLYYDGSGAIILDLSSGATTKVSSDEPVDWAPPPPSGTRTSN